VTATATPTWLLDREVGLCPCGCVGKRTKVNFVDKTIGGSASLLQRVIFADDTAADGGLLQRVDARIKIVTLVALVVAASLVHHIPVLVVMYLATLPLAGASHLPIGVFVKRVWLFIPIFTGIVVLPATFSFVTHGHIVVPLGHWFGHRVGLTAQGMRSAGLIVVRVATSISLVVLLTLTTSWARLLAMVLGMAYRYLFLLLSSVTDMYVARKARTVGSDSDTVAGRAFVGATAGALFGKAHALSDEVYDAMISRGYTGNPRTIDDFEVRRLDLMWTVACLLAGVLVLWWDHVLGR
jgi:cobalt/nickel transport system permease protein